MAARVKQVVKQVDYSPAVRARFDARRPRYTEAVKSLAAFAPDARVFRAVVGHLDDACREAAAIARETFSTRNKKR